MEELIVEEKTGINTMTADDSIGTGEYVVFKFRWNPGENRGRNKRIPAMKTTMSI